MSKRLVHGLMAAILGSVVCFANTAHAVVPPADDTEYIFLGTVNVSGVGLRTVVCYNDPNGSNDDYVIVGNGSGLTGHVDVYGYPAGGSSLPDTFEVIRASNSSATGFCSTGGGDWTAGTWSPPMMNGESVTFFGGSGNDYMRGGGGTDQVFLLGQNGDDTLITYSGPGSVYGGGGDDDVVSYASATNDSLYGQTGSNDCLHDDNSLVNQFNCGSTAVGDHRDDMNGGVSYTQCYASPNDCW